METLRNTIASTVALAALTAAPALAAEGEGSSLGLWIIVFLALGALVVLFQAVPAVILFVSLVRSLFAPNRAEQRSRKTA